MVINIPMIVKSAAIGNTPFNAYMLLPTDVIDEVTSAGSVTSASEVSGESNAINNVMSASSIMYERV